MEGCRQSSIQEPYGCNSRLQQATLRGFAQSRKASQGRKTHDARKGWQISQHREATCSSDFSTLLSPSDVEPDTPSEELDDNESELLNQYGSSGVLKIFCSKIPVHSLASPAVQANPLLFCEGIMPQGRGILPVSLAARVA
jgi:hypothetical protein